YLSDASGWFQVVRLAADGKTRTVLTSGNREHGEPTGGFGYAPLPSPDGSRFVHNDVHDGLIDLVIAPIAGAPPVKPRRAGPRPEDPAGDGRGGRGPGRDPVAGRGAQRRLHRRRHGARRDRREPGPAAGRLAVARPRRGPGERPPAPGDQLDAGGPGRRLRP